MYAALQAEDTLALGGHVLPLELAAHAVGLYALAGLKAAHADAAVVLQPDADAAVSSLVIQRAEAEREALVDTSVGRQRKGVGSGGEVNGAPRQMVGQFHRFVTLVAGNAQLISAGLGGSHAQWRFALLADGRKERIAIAVAHGVELRHGGRAHPLHTVGTEVKVLTGLVGRHGIQLQHIGR